MSQLRFLCIFCGSSAGFDPVWRDIAAAVGRALAERNIALVYGGGHLGLMGVVAQSCMDHGGHVVGIIPEHLMTSEKAYLDVPELQIVGSMHERKKAMFERADAFCILPGGLGTLDETFEILTWKQIGLHHKPVLFLNAENYWEPLLAAIDHAIRCGFTGPATPELYSVVPDLSALLEQLDTLPAAIPANSGDQI